jgi:hypothetical protein
MTNKAETNKALKQLEKLGCRIFNFSSQRKMPLGLKAFVDHHIISTLSGHTFYIEDKFGRDKLSNAQESVKLDLLSCANHNEKLSYYLNDGNTQAIVDDIITKITGMK